MYNGHYSNINPLSVPFPELTITEFDTLSQLNNVNSEATTPFNNSTCSSGYSSYGGSPTSVAMERSASSHSLHHTNHHRLSAFFAELLDSDQDPLVRRVYSTGDLQRINGMQHGQSHHHHSDSPLSSESSMIIEGMNRVCRYSPEEKKLRIERYRSKRNQRNFNKKIKYACRKTLADSRPRVRGRFARNDETDQKPTVQWSHIGAAEEEDEDEDENWASIFDSIVAAANLAQESQASSTFGLLY